MKDNLHCYVHVQDVLFFQEDGCRIFCPVSSPVSHKIWTLENKAKSSNCMLYLEHAVTLEIPKFL